MRGKSWAVGALVGCLTALAVTAGAATFTDGSPGDLSMNPGDNLHVQCPTQLAVGNMSSTAFDATCAPMPVTTTTTVPAPPTTTTIPATTTTQPAPTTTVPAPTTTTTSPPVAASPSSCRFASAPAGTTPALCETFDSTGSGTGRSPALPSFWGVSRMLGNTNSGQGQYNAAIPTILDRCGTNVNVTVPNDVQVCNGQLVEAVTDGVGFDNGTVTSLAMYPKQPFDFTGRTGTISFDVSDDSAGNHRAWPELWFADGPQPDPFTHFSSWQATPKDGFGIRFAGCGVSGPVLGVDSAVVVNNYVSNDSFAGDFPSGGINVQSTGCMNKSSGVGNMNHIEVRVSSNVIDVYGTNAGDVNGQLIHLSHITGFNMTTTRGIVWLEDVHYNANKDGCQESEPCTPKDATAQGTHTFSWDNLGFDGPRLPRDITFDAPDNTTHPPFAPATSWTNLGYPVPANVAVPDVTIPAGTSSAFLLFNYSANNAVPITYSVNGGTPQSYTANDPLCYTQNGATQCSNRTAKVPIPVSDLVPGNNVVHLSGSGIDLVSNIDILLPGVGG